MAKEANLTKPESTQPEVMEQRRVHSPAVDIWESDSEVLLYADLPGVIVEELDIRYEDGKLTLEGRRQPTEHGMQLGRGEYLTADWRRVFTVPETIDAEGIDAKLTNGVLALHLPKLAKAQPRRIEVKGV